MLGRNNQHIGTGIRDLLNEHPIHGDSIDMAFDRLISDRTDSGDNLIASHQFHILKIMHIGSVGMDIVDPCVADFFYQAGNIPVIYMS